MNSNLPGDKKEKPRRGNLHKKLRLDLQGTLNGDQK